MSSLVSKVASRCNISEQQARLEIAAEAEVLMNDEDITCEKLSEMAYDLGLDMDDIMSNPEALLTFM